MSHVYIRSKGPVLIPSWVYVWTNPRSAPTTRPRAGFSAGVPLYPKTHTKSANACIIVVFPLVLPARIQDLQVRAPDLITPPIHTHTHTGICSQPLSRSHLHSRLDILAGQLIGGDFTFVSLPLPVVVSSGLSAPAASASAPVIDTQGKHHKKGKRLEPSYKGQHSSCSVEPTFQPHPHSTHTASTTLLPQVTGACSMQISMCHSRRWSFPPNTESEPWGGG